MSSLFHIKKIYIASQRFEPNENSLFFYCKLIIEKFHRFFTNWYFTRNIKSDFSTDSIAQMHNFSQTTCTDRCWQSDQTFGCVIQINSGNNTLKNHTKTFSVNLFFFHDKIKWRSPTELIYKITNFHTLFESVFFKHIIQMREEKIFNFTFYLFYNNIFLIFHFCFL